MTRNRWLVRALFVVVVATLATTGYLTGFRPLPILGIPEATFAMLSFGGFIAVSSVLFARRMRASEDCDPLDARVTAVVPTYRDANVLHHSVESLVESAHPVDVWIVCEPDDEDGVETARAYAKEYDAVTCLVNPSSGSKAGGINAVVERADTDYFGVFDADQEVENGFFTDASGYLRDHDVVQARFIPRSNGWVESLAYYEFTLFGQAFRQVLFAVTNFRMATSKALLFSREAIETVSGYDPDMISEDYDFAHRAYLAGLDVKMLYTHLVSEESVHSFRDWWGQRKRWMTGNTQVLHRLIRYTLDDPRDHRNYVSLAVAILSVGGSAFLLSIVPKVLVFLETGSAWAVAVPLLAIYAVAVGARLADGLPLGWAWILTPLVLPLFSLITVNAVLDYLFAFEGEWFAVEKGENEGEPEPEPEREEADLG